MITATILKATSFASSYLASSVYDKTFNLMNWDMSTKTGFFTYNGIIGAIFTIFVIVVTVSYLEEKS
jgi:hypothetical protein